MHTFLSLKIRSTTNCRQSSSRSLARINKNKTQRTQKQPRENERARNKWCTHTHHSKRQTQFQHVYLENCKHFFVLFLQTSPFRYEFIWCDVIHSAQLWSRRNSREFVDYKCSQLIFMHTQAYTLSRISNFVLYLQFKRMVNRFCFRFQRGRRRCRLLLGKYLCFGSLCWF